MALGLITEVETRHLELGAESVRGRVLGCGCDWTGGSLLSSESLGTPSGSGGRISCGAFTALLDPKRRLKTEEELHIT